MGQQVHERGPLKRKKKEGRKIMKDQNIRKAMLLKAEKYLLLFLFHGENAELISMFHQ